MINDIGEIEVQTNGYGRLYSEIVVIIPAPTRDEAARMLYHQKCDSRFDDDGNLHWERWSVRRDDDETITYELSCILKLSEIDWEIDWERSLY